nr:hypothetical protein [Tanacetum cinerariifolium]
MQGNIILTEQILVNPAYPEQLVTIGTDLSVEGSNQLKSLLKRNTNIFAWEPSDMTGVRNRIIKYSLSVDPLERSVSQKRKVFCPEKSWAITKEVDEWLRAGIIRPVKYPTWISNPVLVKKIDGSWRMCIDFKNINGACPKDYYPLPEIDSKIEAVMGFPLKCFLDAYKGYHQVQMAEEDEEKTAFYTNGKCSPIEPGGNAKSGGEAGSTKSFPLSVGRKVFTFLRNIKRHYQGKQARLPVDRKGGKCIPRSQEDDFRPAGSNNALPKRNFVCVLSDTRRGSKCIPIGGKARKTSSGTLCKQNYARYGAKLCSVGKMALALGYASMRLRRYFEAHPITVITDQPIKQILSKADTSGRLAPYVVELGAYNITYEPRNAIKGQVPADFINEIPVGSNAKAPLESHCEIDQQKDCKEEWTLYTNGAASAKGSGAGLVLISPTKTENTYALRLNFKSTNNQAKYEALLAGLRIAKKMGVESLSVKVDSKLVASQINGNYEACKENMIRYLNKAKEYIEMLDVPSMDVQEINAMVEEEGETWMTPIINCLERETWPKDQNEAHALRMKISQYVMEEGVLFKRSYLMPMLRCVGSIASQLCCSRNSHGGMQHAPKSKIGGSKSNSSGVLLANDAPRRKRSNTQIRLMPDPLSNSKVTQNLDDINHGTMAVLSMKNGCVGAANGLVERANRSLMEGIKTRLGRERKGWVDELPNVLWAHRTSLKTSYGETPYSLTFGSEAVIPAEIAIREAKYKMKVEQYYSKRVRPMSFKVGEYVYRKNEASRVENLGKLGPKWEGPNLKVEAYQNGSYKLRTMDDREVPRVWHAINLRKCL